MQEFELNTTIIRPEPDECDLAEEQEPQQKERVCPYCGNSGCYICLSHDEF